jgi:hypothetical protein
MRLKQADIFAASERALENTLHLYVFPTGCPVGISLTFAAPPVNHAATA